MGGLFWRGMCWWISASVWVGVKEFGESSWMAEWYDGVLDIRCWLLQGIIFGSRVCLIEFVGPHWGSNSGVGPRFGERQR